MRSDEVGKFTKRDAQRIANCVASYERGHRRQKPIKYQRNQTSGGGAVRLGKTTSAWNKGTLTDILLYEDGDPPNETTSDVRETLTGCVNKFADIEDDKWVMLAKARNGRWYVIAAEC